MSSENTHNPSVKIPSEFWDAHGSIQYISDQFLDVRENWLYLLFIVTEGHIL